MAETLAIMRDVGLGLRDRNHPMMWFTVYESEGVASLQCISWEETEKLITDGKVTDTKSLEGHACWVESSEGLCRFLRLAKI